MLPLGRFRSGEFAWSNARKAFFDGFHASLAAYADAGNDLILEHILDTEGWLDDLQRRLAGHEVFFVAVHCPLEVLIQREHQRGDRPTGSAARDIETIHVGKVYDLELNSSNGLDANIQSLLAAWRNPGGPRSGFRNST